MLKPIAPAGIDKVVLYPVSANPGQWWTSLVRRRHAAIMGPWRPSSFVWKSAQDVTKVFVFVRSAPVTTRAADGGLLLLRLPPLPPAG